MQYQRVPELRKNDVVTMIFMNAVLNVIIYSYKIYLKNSYSDKRHMVR